MTLSKMNYDEIDFAIAVDVMKWKSEKSPLRAKDDIRELSWRSNTGSLRRKSSWNPSMSIADAWQVVEKMIDLGFAVKMKRDNFMRTFWQVTFNSHKGLAQKDCEKHYVGMCNFEKAPRAICEAALMVVGEME